MHAPLNGVGMTPVINILAIPSRRIHSTITPHHLVAICCVIDDYFMKYLPIPASTLKFMCILVRHMTVRPLLRLFARS